MKEIWLTIAAFRLWDSNKQELFEYWCSRGLVWFGGIWGLWWKVYNIYIYICIYINILFIYIYVYIHIYIYTHIYYYVSTIWMYFFNTYIYIKIKHIPHTYFKYWLLWIYPWTGGMANWLAPFQMPRWPCQRSNGACMRQRATLERVYLYI